MEDKLHDNWTEGLIGKRLDVEMAKKKGWKGRKNKDIKRWKISFPTTEQCDCCFSTSIELNIVTDHLCEDYDEEELEEAIDGSNGEFRNIPLKMRLDILLCRILNMDKNFWIDLYTVEDDLFIS